MINQVINHAKSNNEKYLKQVFELLRIPSISTLAEHKKDCLKAATWLSRYMKKIGLEHVKLVKTSGNPIVYGDWLHAKGKPTVLIYGHYDVQPADPLDEWKTPPFEPTIRGNRLYGRGTSDNKCQHFIFLAAVASYLKTNKKLPVNIKFAIEGSEETGSMYFEKSLMTNKKLFSHDLSIISDLGMNDKNSPAIKYGLRGLLYVEITVSGPSHDLHSGTYGGVIENPANVIINLLSSLKDKHGNVQIPGFYEDIIKTKPGEKKLLAKSARKASDILNETGVKKFASKPGHTYTELRKIHPTFDINGIASGFSGEGAKTIIPAIATAKISMRLVPKQNPTIIFKNLKKHVLQHAPDTVNVRVENLASEPAVIVDYHSQEVKAAKKALKKTFKNKATFSRIGGSIPAVGHISKTYQKPVIMTGFMLPDSRLHAPNENFYLPNFQKGIEAAIRIFDELSHI